MDMTRSLAIQCSSTCLHVCLHFHQQHKWPCASPNSKQPTFTETKAFASALQSHSSHYTHFWAMLITPQNHSPFRRFYYLDVIVKLTATNRTCIRYWGRRKERKLTFFEHLLCTFNPHLTLMILWDKDCYYPLTYEETRPRKCLNWGHESRFTWLQSPTSLKSLPASQALSSAYCPPPWQMYNLFSFLKYFLSHQALSYVPSLFPLLKMQ